MDPRHDPLDRIDEGLTRIARRQAYADRNRLTLLAIHGIGGVAITALLFHDGPAPAVADALGDHIDLFNLLPGIGGALLLAGLLARRFLPLEAPGMGLLLAWDVAMAGIFYTTARTSATDGDPATIAVTYPVAVYAILGALMVTHLLTLVQLLQDTE